MPMDHFPARTLLRRWPMLATVFICLASQPSRAANEADAPKGAAVTVIKATKSCFPAIVEVSGHRSAARGDLPCGRSGWG